MTALAFIQIYWGGDSYSSSWEKWTNQKQAPHNFKTLTTFWSLERFCLEEGGKLWKNVFLPKIKLPSFKIVVMSCWKHDISWYWNALASKLHFKEKFYNFRSDILKFQFFLITFNGKWGWVGWFKRFLKNWTTFDKNEYRVFFVMSCWTPSHQICITF